MKLKLSLGLVPNFLWGGENLKKRISRFTLGRESYNFNVTLKCHLHCVYHKKTESKMPQDRGRVPFTANLKADT